MTVKARTRQPVKRVTNEQLFGLINGEVLPEIKEVRGILKRAGLDNGHAEDVRAFFDKRADRQAAVRWLSKTFQPVARFRVIAALVGFLSALAWTLLGFHQLLMVYLPHLAR